MARRRFHPSLGRALLSSLVPAMLVGLMACATPAHAQSYPTRPVKLIVPYPPGGATDVIGRVLAQQLTSALGQPVVVENRAGAAGNVGAAAVAKEKPDGQTLLMGALTSHSISSVLYGPKALFNMKTDFEPIAIVGRVPLVITVGPSVKSANLAEFIALAKSRPGALSYASSGAGSPQHLAAELFQRQAGVKLLHVPYKGSSPALNDLLGGQVDVIFDTLSATQAFIQGGKLRALAVTTAQRVPSLPAVPTASEAGLSDFEVSSTFGILAPAGTSQPIVDKLSGAIKSALAQQEVKDMLIAQGATPSFSTPEQTRVAVQSEVARWEKVITASQIKLD